MTVEKMKELIKDYNFKGKGEFLEKCLKYNGDDNDLYNELISDKFTDIDDILEVLDSKQDVARAIYFGNIKNWNDDYFYFNGYGNIESQNQFEYLEDFEKYGYDILTIMIDCYIDDDNIENMESVDDLIEYIKNEIL